MCIIRILRTVFYRLFVRFTSSSHSDSIVEVVGMANADGTVSEEASSLWGAKLDMDSYNGLVVLGSDKYAHLFGGTAPS